MAVVQNATPALLVQGGEGRERKVRGADSCASDVAELN